MNSTKTGNLGLDLVNFNTIPWHQKVNDNFSVIDTIISQMTGISNLKGIFKNSTEYSIGDRYTDHQELAIYEALQNGVTSADNTFAEERIANPTHWRKLSADELVATAAQAIAAANVATQAKVYVENAFPEIEQSIEEFYSLYYGISETDPDINDYPIGTVFIEGALYFNSVGKLFKSWDGANWIGPRDVTIKDIEGLDGVKLFHVSSIEELKKVTSAQLKVNEKIEVIGLGTFKRVLDSTIENYFDYTIEGGLKFRFIGKSITLEHFEVDIYDDTTDQSDGINSFFNWLSENPAIQGFACGRVLGQNIRIKSGVQCFFDNFTLIVPDDNSNRGLVQTDRAGGWSAVFGIYSAGNNADGGRLKNVVLTGNCTVRSITGDALATNGTMGATFIEADECIFDCNWHFKGLSAGFTGGNLVNCSVGKTFGSNMRGVQATTRIGTAGTILNIYDCDSCYIGFVHGVNIWKPSIYCSPGYDGPSKNIYFEGVHAKNAHSGESHAFGARHLIDSHVNYVCDIEGITALFLVRNSYDNGLDHRVQNITFGTVIAKGTFSPPPPFNTSLNSCITITSYDGEGDFDDGIINTGIHIDHLIIDDCESFGIYRKRGIVTIDKVTVKGQADSNIRELITGLEKGYTHIKTLDVQTPISNEYAIIGGESELIIDTVYANINTDSDTLLMFFTDSVDASINIGKVVCRGEPVVDVSYKYGHIIYGANTPLKNLNVNEIDYGVWPSVNAIYSEASTYQDVIKGMPKTTFVPVSGTFETNQEILINDKKIYWNGTEWVGNLGDGGTLVLNDLGAISVSPLYSRYAIDTYGGASTDTLARIYGGIDTQRISLHVISDSRSVNIIGVSPSGYVVVKGGTALLDDPGEPITLEFDASYGGWKQV